MNYDYYYGPEAEQFSFYRIPKMLFESEKTKSISTDAKLLYGIMLDRMQLSVRNHWLDEEGRVYIYFTLEQIKKAMGCAKAKAVKLLDELEENAELIERQRQGLKKPNKIYVKNFLSVANCVNSLKFENQTSGSMEIKLQEVRKSNPSNTDMNNTDISDTEYISSINEELSESCDYQAYKDYLYKKLEYEYLIQSYPLRRDMIDEIIELLVDVLCSNKKSIRICGEEKPISLVKSRFMKLDSDHIGYVLDCMLDNTTKVKNIKAYLLSSLYNAPLTIGSYYTALVNNDRANGII